MKIEVEEKQKTEMRKQRRRSEGGKERTKEKGVDIRGKNGREEEGGYKEWKRRKKTGRMDRERREYEKRRGDMRWKKDIETRE